MLIGCVLYYVAVTLLGKGEEQNAIKIRKNPFLVLDVFICGRAYIAVTPRGGDVSTASLENKHQNVKMAPRSVIKGVLLVSFSVFLTLVLGVGLPALLNALMRLLGLPETSVSECIVLLYLCFVLCVATPRVPRGFEKVVFLTRK